MDMGLTIVVVLVVLAAIVVVALLAAQSRRRRQEQQRIEAAEHRHEAEIRSASAQRREAEASERAARAEHEQAQAREQAARARQDREVAEARHAAADRVDPDRRTGGDSRDTTGTADPAGRTDDLRLGADRPGPDARDEQAGPRAGADAAPPRDGDGQGADPAARTDDLRLGAGRDEARQREQGEPAPHWQTGGGWHGPTASGGFRAVDPAARDTAPAEGGTPPRHSEGSPASSSAPTGLGEQAAPGPAVPSQRTGEHDRDQRQPAEGEHSGPVRALADRLLHRRR
jgi:hypothetical protein